MSKKSNDSIEEFFKKGVRKSDITFRESDWQKMEKMLDEKAVVGSAGTSRTLKRIVSIALIVALLSSLYFLIPDKDQASSEQANRLSNTSEINEASSPVKPEKTVADKSSSKTESGSVAAVKDLPKASNETTVRKLQDKKEKPGNASIEEAASSSNAGSAPLRTKLAVAPQQKQEIDNPKAMIASDAKQQDDISSVNLSNDLRPSQPKDVPGAEESAHEKSSSRNIDQVSNATSVSQPLQAELAIVPQQRQNIDRQLQGISDVRNAPQKQGDIDSVSINNDRNAREPRKSSVVVSTPVQRGSIANGADSASNAASALQPSSPQIATENQKADDPRRDEIIEPSLKKTGLSPSSVVISTDAKDDSVDLKTEEQKFIPIKSAQSEVDEDKNEKTISLSRWSMALVIAPEFSSTSLDKQTEPGSAYGLTIGYRILNRLTISAGILKTQKKYVGYGEDYQPPEGYWEYKTNGVVPDEVSGQCSVIEIPLMLQFDVLQNEKSRLFVAGGVSSYRMLDEAYRYTFNEPNDGAADGWSTDQPSSYYFSVGHLSLGYDRRLYRGLSVGIEPYIKMPFKGIGWSNVDLLTMGAYVNLRYTFSKRN